MISPPKRSLSDQQQHRLEKSLDLPDPKSEERLHFRVPEDFHSKFIIFAATHKLSQKDLFMMAFDAFHEDINKLSKTEKKEHFKELKELYKD